MCMPIYYGQPYTAIEIGKPPEYWKTLTAIDYENDALKLFINSDVECSMGGDDYSSRRGKLVLNSFSSGSNWAISLVPL